MILLAAGLAAVAAWLLVPGRPRATRGPAPGPGHSASAGSVVLAAGFLAVLVVDRPTLGVLAAVAGGGVAGMSALLRQRARRRAATRVSGLVLESCELIAAELGAGLPPGRCLDRAARVWPPLAAVAEAFRMGADVPGAFRQVAELPGAVDLRLVGAAWQVAHRTGQGLADTVQAVAADLRAAAASRRVVEGELASARATARLVGGLPLLALAMGSGAGGDPWGFLLGTPLGLGCLAGGLALGLAGLAWIESIARDVERR